jgi:hypothetical protein
VLEATSYLSDAAKMYHLCTNASNSLKNLAEGRLSRKSSRLLGSSCRRAMNLKVGGILFLARQVSCATLIWCYDHR